MKYDKWSINYYHKFHELYNDTNFISLNSCNSSICVIRDEVNWCENEHCNFLTGHYWHSIAWFKPTDIYDTISTSSCQGQKFPTLVAELATILTVVWSRIPEVLGLRLQKISHGEFLCQGQNSPREKVNSIMGNLSRFTTKIGTLARRKFDRLHPTARPWRILRGLNPEKRASLVDMHAGLRIWELPAWLPNSKIWKTRSRTLSRNWLSGIQSDEAATKENGVWKT